MAELKGKAPDSKPNDFSLHAYFLYLFYIFVLEYLLSSKLEASAPLKKTVHINYT